MPGGVFVVANAVFFIVTIVISLWEWVIYETQFVLVKFN